MGTEFKGKNILIVDDSIVRGTTSKEIVEMARAAGANKVTFTSAAPPVRYPHVYGINMPSRQELVAHGRKIPEIATRARRRPPDLPGGRRHAGRDHSRAPRSTELDMSCFTGEYVTGTVTEEYLAWVEATQLS